MSLIQFTPPPTINEFIKRHLKGELFYTWIVGPFGSAKTTGMIFKLAYMASLQEPSPDGVRYTRAIVVRNTAPQLRDNTLVSWNYWFQDGQAGEWRASENKFTLRFSDVECEVLFRPLDTPGDVARALGLEIDFALLDEFREIPRAIREGLSGRLGRYKRPGNTPCTNWGMWGASNPGTEDNEWYDYLHSTISEETGKREGCVPITFERMLDPAAQAEYQRLQGFPSDEALDEFGQHLINSWYYHQPGGLSASAENIENLPGKRGYYTNLAKGKSKAWVKQYIDAEWGFSIAGTPVIAAFDPELHLAKQPVRYDPRLPLILGLDPGLGGSAVIFGQREFNGRVNVLGELVQRGMGVERIVKERINPYIQARFPKARIRIAPDPAAANRSSNDEKSAVMTLKRFFPGAVDAETNNRLPLRINAYDHFCTTTIPGVGPALQIDATFCPVFVRALKGGWRFGIDVKKDEIKGAEPEKNQWSHPGDAGGYLLRYFHRGIVSADRFASNPLPRQNYQRGGYHAR